MLDYYRCPLCSERKLTEDELAEFEEMVYLLEWFANQHPANGKMTIRANQLITKYRP